jgi:hypothetical protein
MLIYQRVYVLQKKTLGGPIVKLNIRKSASEMTITDSAIAECTSSFHGEI